MLADANMRAITESDRLVVGKAKERFMAQIERGQRDHTISPELDAEATALRRSPEA